MKIINYLFNKGYLPDSHKHFKTDKNKKKIYNDPKHQEFKEALLHDICKLMAKNIDCLHRPVINLEMKGEYNAIFRIYSDMIELFSPENTIKSEGRIDPLRKIEESVKKLAKNFS